MVRNLSKALGVAFIICGAVFGTSSMALGSSFQYCVGDNVIPGGVHNAGEVQSAYSQPRVSHVYRYFGITESDIDGLGSQQVSGTVTKTGKVYANSKLVATGAMSAGCGYIAGSTKVNDGYMTFYTRPTSVSFAKSSLSAMVVMRNGQFSYAILNSCGNPVKATPVRIKPTVQAKTTAPAKTATTVQVQTQSQSQSVVVNNSPPQVEGAETTTPSAPAESLPNTGPGNVLGISGIATAVGSVSHYVYRRRRR